MGANRNFSRMQALEREVKKLYAYVSIGATGAPTLSAAKSKGISSISRSGTGAYTLTLEDSYYQLLMAQFCLLEADAENLGFQVTAEDVDGAKTLSFLCSAPSVSASGSTSTTVTMGAAESGVLTFEAVADITDEEFVILTDAEGKEWAFAFDKTGSSAAPSDALWTAVPTDRKVQVDVSGDTTAADVADAVEAALNALAGFSGQFIISDAAADGTMTIIWADEGAVAAPASYLDDGAQGAGGVAYAQSVAGTDDTAASSTSVTPSVSVAAADPSSGSVLLIELSLKNSSV